MGGKNAGGRDDREVVVPLPEGSERPALGGVLPASVDPLRAMPQWARPEEPDIIGLVVRALYPGEPDRDDGRRWTHEAPGRWMLLRNGVWFWDAVLGVTGAAVAVGFACQTCHGKMSTNVHDVRDGYCGHCHAQTGTALGRVVHAALIAQQQSEGSP